MGVAEGLRDERERMDGDEEDVVEAADALEGEMRMAARLLLRRNAQRSAANPAFAVAWTTKFRQIGVSGTAMAHCPIRKA